MDIWTLDFETYFDQEYSLSKMSTEAYVRSQRFEPLCLAVKRNDMPAAGIPKEEIADFLRSIDWSKEGILCHHAQFDGLILSHHYGVRPGRWFDTLSMARQCIGTHVSVSLESLAKHYGLHPKSVPYELFKGRHWEQLPPAVCDALLAGSAHDADLTWEIFNRMARGIDSGNSRPFPIEEYPIIDLTIRMFTEPELQADIPRMRDLWLSEELKRRDMIQRLNVSRADLSSAEKFADLLRQNGVEPEKKPGKNGPIYAFAKNDDFMRGLVEDEDPEISLLAQARIGIKSTIDQSRVETLGQASLRGPLPVYLRYCGAHTTRWSGGDGTNWQNFRRGGELRKAIVAPPGYKLAVVDSSQIECRLLNYIAGQQDVVERFREGLDPYTGFASAVYGHEVTKEDKLERGTGKQGELSCGYQSGWATFQRTAKLGIYGPPQKLTEAECRYIVDMYRKTHPEVVKLWAEAARMIARLAGGDPMIWRDCMELRDGKIYGPNGSWLDYSTLRYSSEHESWVVAKRNGWTKLYGGKLVENVIQWLARIIISQAMLRVRAAGYKIVMTTHDEIVVLVKADGTEDAVLAWLIEEMCREVPWLPGLPLGAEGGVDFNYSK